MELCEFKDSLVYRVNFRTAKADVVNPVSKNNRKGYLGTLGLLSALLPCGQAPLWGYHRVFRAWYWRARQKVTCHKSP